MEQKIRCDRFMGANLRRLRDQMGISQEKLCAELQRRGCDIARSCYAKYEAGELNIRVSVLIELKRFMAVPTMSFSLDWMSSRMTSAASNQALSSPVNEILLSYGR